MLGLHQFFKRSNDVRTSHLLAPSHHEIRVVQRPRFNEASFRCSVDSLGIKWRSNQCLPCFDYFNGSGRYSAENQLCIEDRAVAREI